MPIRFRKTYKILPGVKVNVSKHGISTSVGPRGMHLTFNRFGVRQSVGLPGTGVSESSYVLGGQHSQHHDEDDAERHHAIHQGEGRGCEMPGCGCFLILLLAGAVLVYFGANVWHWSLLAPLTQWWQNLIH